MSRKTGDISKHFGKDWKVPRGFPFDDESKKEIKSIKEKNGNGWFVFNCLRSFFRFKARKKIILGYFKIFARC